MENNIIFGPVPSRRLGRSLGINNIPPKHCTYSCIYCQLGRTYHMESQRRGFYNPHEIFRQTKNKLEEAQRAGASVDYLTFVADGEPTLDRNLGDEMDLLKSLNTLVAVISNSSLIWMEDVRRDLNKADWVSLKIDSVNRDTWKKIDRPHGSLNLKEILQGIRDFSKDYKGFFATETMLVRGINDTPAELKEIAGFIAELNPRKSYISIPIRPPAESSVYPPSEDAVNIAFQIFSERNIDVEYLIGYEGNEFSSTGSVREDILSITAVHPMREDALLHLLKKSGAGMEVVTKMVDEGKMIMLEFAGTKFYMRRLKAF